VGIGSRTAPEVNVNMVLHRQHSSEYELSAHRRSSLLKPGWAGELSPEEFAFVRSQLHQSSSLRRRWGFRASARRLSETRIREIAREGLQAIGRRVLASAIKNK